MSVLFLEEKKYITLVCVAKSTILQSLVSFFETLLFQVPISILHSLNHNLSFTGAPMSFLRFRFFSSSNPTFLYYSLLNHSHSRSPLWLRSCHSHFRSIPNDFDVDNAVLQMRHTPSIVEFTKILTSLVKTKNHYPTVLSLSRQMESKELSLIYLL